MDESFSSKKTLFVLSAKVVTQQIWALFALSLSVDVTINLTPTEIASYLDADWCDILFEHCRIAK